MIQFFITFFSGLTSLMASFETGAMALEQTTNRLLIDEDDTDGAKALAELKSAEKYKHRVRASRDPKSLKKLEAEEASK